MRLRSPLFAILMACGGASPQHGAKQHGAEQHGAEQHGAGGPAQGADTGHGSAEHGHGHHAGQQHAEHGHHGPDPLGHRFERAEDYVARLENPERDAWQKPAYVVSLLRLEPGMTVADIGAGTGYFLSHLARAVGPRGKVLGLDIEPDMVRYMTERAAREHLSNVEARKVATDDPGLAPGSVDRILIVNTWHHIPARLAYAAKLATALRPGGMIYIVDFHMDTEHGPPREHRLEAKAVVAELEAAGLEAEILAREDLDDQYVVTARAR